MLTVHTLSAEQLELLRLIPENGITFDCLELERFRQRRTAGLIRGPGLARNHPRAVNALLRGLLVRGLVRATPHRGCGSDTWHLTREGRATRDDGGRIPCLKLS